MDQRFRNTMTTFKHSMPRRPAQLLAFSLLLLAGLASGQNTAPVTIDCSVTITQPNATSFRTRIACTSQDNTTGFFVVVQNATALSNSVTYTLNGVTQGLGDTATSTYLEDGSLVFYAFDNTPALVAFGFFGEMNAADPVSGSPLFQQAGSTLSITASIVNVAFPGLVVRPSFFDGVPNTTRPFSGLRFSGIETLVIRDSIFSGISTSGDPNYGRAAVAYVDDNLDAGFSSNPMIAPTITVSNTSFSGFAGGIDSGALTFQKLLQNPYGVVTITDTNFTLNTASGNGPALYGSLLCPDSIDRSTCTQQMAISNCRFTSNNSTLGRGGAIYLEGGTMQLSGGSFTNNSAGSSGGALFFTSLASDVELHMSGTVFSANIAGTSCGTGCNVENDGGAAMAVITSQLSSQTQTWSGSTVMTVQDSTFINNQNALVNVAGAVLFGRDRTQGFDLMDTFLNGSVTQSTGLFQNVTFTNNYIPRGETTGTGGAIYDIGSQGLTVSNCTFFNNTAGRGAAIYSLWATYLNITGGTVIQSCTSLRAFGGAVAMSDLGRSLVIKNATFKDNTCRSPTTSPMSAGAAVWMERQVVENPDVPFNYTASISDATFSNNRCQMAGALYISQVEHTIGPNVIFDGNRANVLGSAGGAVYLDGLTDPAYLASAQASTMTGTIFRNNKADSNGGALYFSGIWRPRMTSCSFLNNSVTTKAVLSDLGNSGGAIYVNELQLAPLVISTTNFTNNTAYQGGALTVGQTDVQMTSCWFDGNVATGDGGALRWDTADLGHQVNITTTNFTRNNASTAGALQVSQAGVVLSGCRFTDNTASLAGGAVAFESCAPAANTTLGLYTPAVSIDSAAMADKQTAYVLASTFERNFADNEGGGAVYADSSRVVFVRSIFTSNNSTQSGGVLYGTKSLINDYLGTYLTNHAQQGGAFYTESCNVTFNSTQLQDNNATRGGAVSAGLARSDSKRPGLVTLELNDCIANGNVADSGIVLGAGYGGCVSAEGSNVTIRGGAWTNNAAAVAGGAIDVRGNSTLVMQDVSTMRLNSATGGTGGAVNIDSLTSALIINTDMQNNTALSDGGSLWIGGTYCVVLVGSTLSSSNTSSGSGGGAYVGLPGTQGCSAALVSPYLSRLTQTGVAALPQALRPPGQTSGRRLLQQSTALDSIALNLLVLDTAFSSNRAVNGGGLALQQTPGAAAVLDQLTVTGCSDMPAGTCSITGRTSTTSSDGGGLYMTMIKPVLSVQTTSTCSVLNQTSTVDITSSALASNAASSGSGGGAAVISHDASLILQATFSNSTITNNTASNGGALSAQGPGAFLSVLAGSRITANTATPPSSDMAAGSSGGCIYALDCQGLLLGNSTQLSQCQALSGAGGRVTVNGVSASTTGRSIGGAVMSDGCQAVVVDGTTITGSSAGVGGGMAARDTLSLVLLNAAITSNTATAGNASASTTSTLDALSGVGGGLWVSGNTATLIRGSTLSGNNAGLLGGAAATITQCFNNASGTAAQVPAALADYPMLAPLASRAANGCYTMSVQAAFVTNNKALGPGSNPSGSGGAFFGISNTSILMSACADIQTPQANSVSRGADLGALRSDLLQVSSCPTNGNLAVGYGDIVATMPFSMGLNQTATAQQVDPSANATDLSAVPLVWFTSDKSLVMPSTSPLTPTVITLRVMDAAGQDVRDSFVSSLFSIAATSPAAATDALDIYGTKVATYDSTMGDFRFNGLSLKAVVGNNYTFAFTLSSTLGGWGQMSPLQLNVVVPDCGDGETYVDDQHTACRTCGGSLFGFSMADTLGMPAPGCLPCPSEGQCSGGAVLVPVDGQWHSSPNSTEMHNCMNSKACARDDDKVASLQNCQSAWYAFKKLVMLNMTEDQISQIALQVLASYNCTLYDVDTLVPLNPAAYLDLLCADGYGGNLCGVCVKNSNGKQTALKSNNQCSECSPDWLVYLITAVLFVANLLIIMIQVFAALGEQMLSNTVQFADIFGAIIGHVQYLIVILKLQFMWPTAITDFQKVISSTTSFAGDAIKFASITCLSDGSPEAQAAYQMGSSLVLPLLLVFTAALIWVICYYWRLYVWYPRLDRLDNNKNGSRKLPDNTLAEPSMGPDQIMVNIQEEEEEAGARPEMPGGIGLFNRSSGGNGPFNRSSGNASTPKNRDFEFGNASQRASMAGLSNRIASSQIPAHSGYGPEADGASKASMPTRGWSDAIRSTTQHSMATVPGVDAEDDAPPPNANQMIQNPAPSLRRNQTDLRRWQLPGAEKAPDEALWFDSAAEEKERQQRLEEDRNKLTLMEKFRLLDKYMTLWQQLAAVIINTCFVVYQGWASAALSPFACNPLDDGQVDSSFPSDFAYYANFQMATAPSGYWSGNMNQACYEGIHLTKWTPIGAVMSFIIGLGIPFAMFLPVFMNRRQLTSADVQLRWGWLYIRFYYGRLPYWMAVQALELLIFIIVQTFTGGFDSVIEQAVILQITLIVILVFNTCMWPLVHPLLILTSFLSNAVLITTLGLAIIIGDGSAWVLTESQANIVGAFLVLINVFFVLLLIVLFYKHLRDVIQEGFLKTTTTTRKVVGRVWQRGLVATRNLRSMKTYTGVRSILGGSRKKRAGDQTMQKGGAETQDGHDNALEQARENAIREVEEEAARERADAERRSLNGA